MQLRADEMKANCSHVHSCCTKNKGISFVRWWHTSYICARDIGPAIICDYSLDRHEVMLMRSSPLWKHWPLPTYIETLKEWRIQKKKCIYFYIHCGRVANLLWADSLVLTMNKNVRVGGIPTELQGFKKIVVWKILQSMK